MSVPSWTCCNGAIGHLGWSSMSKSLFIMSSVSVSLQHVIIYFYVCMCVAWYNFQSIFSLCILNLSNVLESDDLVPCLLSCTAQIRIKFLIKKCRVQGSQHPSFVCPRYFKRVDTSIVYRMEA